MKVTFTGNFSEVYKQVGVPTTVVDQTKSKFSSLIGELEIPKKPEKSAILEQSPPSAIQFDSSEVMGRYDFSSYNLQSSDKNFERLGEGEALPGVKISASDLKPPSIISAKRIASSNIDSILPKPEIASLINKTGTKEGVDPQLALAVARAESAFNPKAVSTDGHASKGLFQLLDSTGKHLHSKLDMDQNYDPFNATMNTKLGVNYLRYLQDIFTQQTELPNDFTTTPGSSAADVEKFAVAAFNAGEGRVASAQSRAKKLGKDPSIYNAVESFLPDSTQQYVTRVLKYKEGYEEEG